MLSYLQILANWKIYVEESVRRVYIYASLLLFLNIRRNKHGLANFPDDRQITSVSLPSPFSSVSFPVEDSTQNKTYFTREGRLV